MLDNPRNVSRWRGTASIPHFSSSKRRRSTCASLSPFSFPAWLWPLRRRPLWPESRYSSSSSSPSRSTVKITEAANIEGQTVASGKLFGVAVFKDGRIGVKEFVHSADSLKGSGPFYGYSTYTFEDGSITARYTGSAKDGRSTGEYTILSGTGAYANATGTGTIESAPNPFKGVNLLNIKLVVKTPGT